MTKTLTELDKLWYALPSWQRVLQEGSIRYVYAQRGPPGRWKLIRLTSLTTKERETAFEAKKICDADTASK